MARSLNVERKLGLTRSIIMGQAGRLERIFFPVTQPQTGHFVSGDLKSFVYARLASFSLRG